jgi:hypothetical protein
MGVTIKKYGVSISFCPKLKIFGKTVGQHIWIFSDKLYFFKTHNKSYIRALWITDTQYGAHDQKIQSLDQFLPQTGDFQ